MIANDMADRVEVLVDRTASRGAPGYEDTELSYILTTAQLHVTKSNISPLTNQKRQGLEESEIRNQGFSALITNASLTPAGSSTSENLPNGRFVDLPTNFMYAISEEAILSTLSSDGVNYLRVPVEVISHNEYTKLKKRPYRKPFRTLYNEGLVWRTQISRTTDGNDSVLQSGVYVPNRTAKRHELITDGSFTVTTYALRYLKMPPAIVVSRDTPANQKNCILDDSVHEAIIETAVKMLKTSVDRQSIPNIAGIESIE